MTTIDHTPGPWDAEGSTVFYAALSEDDAVTFIEIRANVTEYGWDTVAFIEANWPGTRSNARFIASAPVQFDALLDIKRLAEKSRDDEANPFALLDLIAQRARDAIAKATEQQGRAP
jgi:hypothetical protein